MAEWVRKQTGASPDLVRNLKYLAWTDGKLLQDLFVDAVSSFLAHRKEVLRKQEPLNYLANPGSAREFNVRLTRRLALEVDKTAAQDGTSTRRVIYTALIFFVDQRGPPPKP